MNMRITPHREWWTPREIAGSGLPDLPESQQGVDRMVRRLNWRSHPQFARCRSGRGGGWEYHWKLFPSSAQIALIRAAEPAPAPCPDRNEMWAYYDSLPAEAKKKAQRCLTILQKVEGLAFALTKDGAVRQVARDEGISGRSIWRWFGLVEGVDPTDWLPCLAPRHRVAPKRARTAEYTPEFFEYLKGAYLRPECPSFSAAYDDIVKIARNRGWVIPHARTMRRRMDEIPRVQRVYAREGMRGLQKCFPPQIRDRSQMVAMEGVNADFHKFDFRVQWPGIEEPIRPQIVAFQDLYSNKFLSWRYDVNPNKFATVSAFGEMVEKYGIPQHVTFDNGREFANKWLTGGVDNRFRFKVLEDDPIGIMPLMGIDLHFATPHHGQAKPIERAFGELADRVAKDPRFAGAYVGSRPDAKPANYGSHVIPFEEFRRVCDEGILAYNARQGRLTDSARGRSFDETFAESYERTPILRATDEQRRLWLLGQEVRVLNRNHGRFKIFDAHYWSDWMTEYAGQKVVGRFDPLDLNAGLYVYSLDGRFLGFAECEQKTAFYEYEEAKTHARRKSAWKREIRKQTRETITVGVKKVAAAIDECATPELEPIENKIVKLAQMTARERGSLVQRPIPVPEIDPAVEARREALVVEFRQRNEDVQEERPADRFRRALDIEARSEAGQPIGSAEADWLKIYRETPEYTRQRMLFDDFGEAGLG